MTGEEFWAELQGASRGVDEGVVSIKECGVAITCGMRFAKTSDDFVEVGKSTETKRANERGSSNDNKDKGRRELVGERKGIQEARFCNGEGNTSQVAL